MDHAPAPEPLASSRWVDAALAATATVDDRHLSTLDLDGGFDRILTGICVGDREAPSPRRRARTAVVAVALSGVTAGGLGIAVAGSPYGSGHAHSGLSTTEGGVTSETINLFADDFPAAAHQIADQMQAQGLRFGPDFHAELVGGTLVLRPGSDPGRTIDTEITLLARAGGTPGPEAVQTSLIGVEGGFAFQAMCTWNLSWLRAHRAGETGATSADVAGMRQLSRLQVMGPISEATFEADQATSAERGDASTIETFVDANCPTLHP